MIKTILVALTFILFLSCSDKSSKKREVTIYVSEDRVFSEPILKEFEKRSGIKVHALYDSEESKSTGIMNRIITEKNNPQADLYWANEPIRAEVLRKKGLLAQYKSPNAKDIAKEFKNQDGYWCGFSARVRLFIARDDLNGSLKSIFDYTNPKYSKKCVIANPLFGTTTSHIAALFVKLGDRRAKEFLDELKRNRVVISSSNGESADFVADKKFDFALVDSDDAISRLREKKGVKLIYPDQKEEELGVFVVPNVLMLLKGYRDKREAKELYDFLISKESEAMLAKANCAQIPLHKGVKGPKDLKDISRLKVMRVDYSKVADKLIEITPLLREWAR